MTYTEAKKDFFNELNNFYNCKNKKELISKLGSTTIRCAWVDYVDYLIKDKRVREKIATKWGQVL